MTLIRFLVALILVQLFFCAQINATNNSKSLQPKSQLPEIHMIVDISGSMKKTDPLNLRAKAIGMFLYLIKQKALVQIHVFSTNTHLLLPLQLATNQYQSQYRKKSVFITSDGEWTDIEEALENANQDWRNSRRIIILLTDGNVDLGSKYKTHQSKSKLIEGVLQRLRKEGVRVFSIGFSKFADKNVLDNLAFKTNGLSYVVTGSKEIDSVLYSIFTAIINPDGTPINQDKDLNRSITIDKNISDLTLIFKKTKQISRLYLIDPKGRKRSIQQMSKAAGISSTNFLFLNIKNPLVGKWILTGPKQEVERAIILTDVRLTSNFNSGTYFQGEAINIECFLTLAGVKMLTAVVIDNTSVRGIIQNKHKKYSYKFTLDDKGVFNTQFNIHFPKDRYQLVLDAKNNFFERQLEFVIDVQDSPLDISVKEDLLIVKLRRNDLIDESTVALSFNIGKETLKFLSFKSSSNWSMDLKTLCSNPSLLKKGSIQFKANTVSGRPFTLELDLPTNACSTLGQFISQTPIFELPQESKLIKVPNLSISNKEELHFNYPRIIYFLHLLLFVLVALFAWVMYKNMSYDEKIKRIKDQLKFEKKYEHL